tara:strand:+ start:1189 stop:1533 length:345 start_codon:yes stop_codon:yes gene_type:complete
MNYNKAELCKDCKMPVQKRDPFSRETMQTLFIPKLRWISESLEAVKGIATIPRSHPNWKEGYKDVQRLLKAMETAARAADNLKVSIKRWHGEDEYRRPFRSQGTDWRRYHSGQG